MPTDAPPEPSAEQKRLATPARRRRHGIRWAAISIGVVAAALVAVLATRPSAATRLADSPLIGKPVPQVVGTTIDGSRAAIDDFAGRWVLINVFATWCVPCRTEHPDLVKFARRHIAIGDAAILGVVYDDSAGRVRAFRKEEGGDWPMLIDPKGRIALDLGVSGVPESFLVSPNGYVVAKLVGGVRKDDLEELLQKARQP